MLVFVYRRAYGKHVKEANNKQTQLERRIVGLIIHLQESVFTRRRRGGPLYFFQRVKAKQGWFGAAGLEGGEKRPTSDKPGPGKIDSKSEKMTKS